MHDAKVREVMLDRYVTRSAAELGIGQPDNGQSKCLASFLTSQNCHPFFPQKGAPQRPCCQVICGTFNGGIAFEC